MANTIPCPNPICTHQFSQTELQAAAQLLCPKCGFRMQGRGPAKLAVAPAKPSPAEKPAVAPKPPPAPPAPKAAPPAKAPVTQPMPATKPTAPQAKPPLAQPLPASKPSPPPLAAPPLAAPPLAAPVAASPITPEEPPVASQESDDSFFNPDLGNDTGTLLRTPTKPQRKFNWPRLLVRVLAIGLGACVAILAILGTVWIFIDLPRFGGGGAERLEGNIYPGLVKGEKVYKLALKREDWEFDRDAKTGFEAHSAWKHKQYDFWFAICVLDYGVQKPRDAEMLRYGIDKLETYYGDALELAAKAEPAKVGDMPAQKLAFKGQIKAANWLGECYMFFHNGFGYWLFLASPDQETVDSFSPDLPKKNFFVESDRRGWREQPPPTRTYASLNKKVTATVPESVWEKHDAKNVDENGELLLSGTYLKSKDNRKNATMLVFTYKKEDDLKTAMKTARDYLVGTIKGDGENMNFKIVHAAEVAPGQTEIGTVENIGNRRGRLIDLKRLFNDEPKPLRYHLLAVVNEPDIGYAIYCDCTWESRQIWRQEFLDILAKMEFKKGD